MRGGIVIRPGGLMAVSCCLIVAIIIVAQATDSSASAGANANASTKSSSSTPSSSSSSSSSGSQTSASNAQSRQTNPFQLLRMDTLASSLRTIGSLVPGLITNVAPLALLLGAATLMMPALGNSFMGLLRESRRSSNEQPMPNLANIQSPFAQYARPLQTSPQDIYYFTKRSLPSLMSNINTDGIMRGMQDVVERVLKAIDNADKRYN